MTKKIIATAIVAAAFVTSGCSTDADLAQHNMAKSADMFEIDRRIVFYNTWKGEYLLEVTGRCSIKNKNNRMAVTCKTGQDQYKMHWLGLSGHVTYFSEQLEPSKTSAYRYRVIFKPESIIPDVDLSTSL